MKRRLAVSVLGAAAIAALLGWWLSRREGGDQSGAPRETEAGASAASDGGRARGATIRVAPRDGGAVAYAPPKGVVAVAPWGSAEGSFGRDRPQEGNPEAPMAISIDRAGNLVVLDQVNGRISRMGKDGKPIGSMPVTQQAPQDVAVADDGKTVVLDRLADKTVAILSADGKLVGELPVEGKGIDEGGAVTGVFVDGDDVYVEREHGPLVKIGETNGMAASERTEIPGRPSRDGASYLRAGIVEPAAGRVYVTALSRPGEEHRFTRELRLGVPLIGIVLLDTDRSGVIYLAVVGAIPTDKPPPEDHSPIVLLACLDPLDGRPLGQAELPPNTTPEETFRDFAVLDEGGVLYQHRTEEGVTVRRYDCR